MLTLILKVAPRKPSQTQPNLQTSPGEEVAKDVDAENPNDVMGSSDESFINTNMTQQNEPEVVPGED